MFELPDITPAPKGVPQIEVTFDIDCNGILNVSAADKSIGRNMITGTHYTGRLRAGEIEQKIKEANQYKAEDDTNRKRIQAKNVLESYAFSTKCTMEDSKRNGKVPEHVCKTVTDKCKQVIEWLDANQLASKEQFEEKKRELEAVCTLMIAISLFQSDGGACSPRGAMPVGIGTTPSENGS